MVNRNLYYSIINVLLLLLGMPLAAVAVSPAQFRCVVIDPGHGGKDPGAVAGKLYEKSINLGVALHLGRMINDRFPNVKVVYTRSTDVAVDLARRSEIANKADADLFISIHTNANPKPTPVGAETYVMGLDKGNKNMEVAMRENSVISFENDYTSRYEGYDPTSAESMIMFSLMQYAYLNQSLGFAELIQSQYVKHGGRVDKGVKQAGFLVLWRTSMPSVLTEVGFISNPEEARFLGSDDGQKKIARSLFEAFALYVTGLESTSATVPNSTKKADSEPPRPEKDNLVYRVQIKSSTSKMAVNSRNFGSYAGGVVEKQIGGRYKYFVEPSDSYKEALLLQKKVRQSFPDAFVVKFRGETPVPL